MSRPTPFQDIPPKAVAFPLNLTTVSMNEFVFISALLSSSALRDLQLENEFVEPLFRAKLQRKSYFGENRIYRSMKIHQNS